MYYLESTLASLLFLENQFMGPFRSELSDVRPGGWFGVISEQLLDESADVLLPRVYLRGGPGYLVTS